MSYRLRKDKGLWPENKQKAFFHLILEGDSFKTIWIFPFPSMFPLHESEIDLACFNLSEGVTGLTRRETYGSICKLLFQNIVDTGRVRQWQTGIARMRQRIVLKQAWVGDRQT